MKYHSVLTKSTQNFDKMEHHAQSFDDALIGGLSYKLKPGASYVTNRRSVSYFASGGNTYSPNGVKVMKFNLAGDQWLDPSTFRVAFQLNNHNGNTSGRVPLPIQVQPLSWNPAVFFRRARRICGGQAVEDIDDFNKLSLMLTDLMPEDDQHDIACEGFVNSDFVKGEAAQAADDRKAYRQDDYDLSGNVNLSRRVMFKPMLGLFNQEKLVPLRCCPIQIELELVNQQADAVTIEPTNGFQMVPTGILVIFSASAIYFNSIRRYPTDMLLIFCLGKVFLLISTPGIILTNLLALIKTLMLISLVL